MKKFFIKFFLIVFISIVALPFSVALPDKALAATKKAPKTTFSTVPEIPGGENGWFTKVTLIELKANQKGKIYYQWNKTDGEWLNYEGQIRAWRGKNVLYYYVLTEIGTKEAIQSKTIKVDYSRPKSAELKVVSNNETLKLSWLPASDANYYIILKGDQKTRVLAERNYFVDTDVAVGRTYGYRIVTVDEAGLTGTSEKVLATVKSAPKIEPVPEAPRPPKVVAQIGKGASTSSETIGSQTKKIQEASKEQVENKNDKDVSQEKNVKVPIKNWNSLLVAISILIIAVGAAIGGYYGYEWWTANKENAPKSPSSKKSDRW